MALLVKLLSSTASEQGEVQPNGVVNNRMATVERVYRVISTTATLTELEARDAEGSNGTDVPAVGDVHPDDGTLYVVSKRARQQESEEYKNWLVTVNYQTIRFEDPTDDDPVVEFLSNQYTKVLDKAWSSGGGDTPAVDVLNSAGDPFDPPIETEDGRIVVRITMNMRNFSPAWKYQYEGSTNLNAMDIVGLTVAEWCARLLLIDIKVMYDNNGDRYWWVQYTIEINPNSYVRKILDAGYYYLNEDGDRTQCTVSGVVVSTPQLLDGEGALLVDGEDPVYLEFYAYDSEDWAVLQIPGELFKITERPA